jgi:hypothetical protein
MGISTCYHGDLARGSHSLVTPQTLDHFETEVEMRYIRRLKDSSAVTTTMAYSSRMA